MRTSILLTAALFVCLVPSDASADDVGALRAYDATKGNVLDTLVVSDLVQIAVAKDAVDGVPVSDVIEGDSVRRISLVFDGTRYLAIYVADRLGKSTVTFRYSPKGTSTVRIVAYTFDVQLESVSRLLALDVKTGALTDVATSAPPLNGVRVGDVIRITIPKAGVIELSSSASGSAVEKATIADDGTSYLINYVAAEPGRSVIGFGFRTNSGDGGGFWAIDVNH